jgi:cysteine desulfurase / selenocysteine lyase
MSRLISATDFSMTIDSVRRQFPALEQLTFLDSACVSLTPQRTVAKLQAFLEMTAFCPSGSSTQHHIDMDAMRSAARPRIAELINASEDDIALVESTTHGLSLVANAIPLKRGDRILLSDLEFLEVALPWVQKREDIGIEIDVLPNRDGQFTPDDVAAAIKSTTRVLAISSVQWSNGFRCDLDAISQLCRKRGVFLVVDAIQQVGSIPFDVQKTPVDAMACGGHKWLMSPFGCGFLYLSKECRARVKPPMGGYLSLSDPPEGWDTYFETPSITPVVDGNFVNTARRWEIGGTANYPGAIALAEGVALINEIGIDTISEHVLSLTDYLIAALQRHNIRVVTPLDRRYRSAIVTFTLDTPQQNTALLDFLQQRKVLVSLRYTSNVGGIRVACHLFNTRADVDRLVEVASEFVRRPAEARA